MSIGYSPIDKLFLDKADLFLIVLNDKWKTAREEADLVDKLLRKHGVKPGSKILDLGCGNGRIAIHLALKGYHVTGIDYSRKFIMDAWDKARQYNVSNVEFIEGDVRQLDEIVKLESYRVALMYWTTIIGYNLDPRIDLDILRRIHKVVERNGYLMILNHALLEAMNWDTLARGINYFSEIGDHALIEKPEYDPVKSIVKTTWVFYRKKGENLEYIDKVTFKLRIYSLHEIVELAEKAGWTLETIYCSLKTLEPYKPGKCSLNIVFKKPG